MTDRTPFFHAVTITDNGTTAGAESGRQIGSHRCRYIYIVIKVSATHTSLTGRSEFVITLKPRKVMVTGKVSRLELGFGFAGGGRV
jgi:hypothetical protein